MANFALRRRSVEKCANCQWLLSLENHSRESPSTQICCRSLAGKKETTIFLNCSDTSEKLILNSTLYWIIHNFSWLHDSISDFNGLMLSSSLSAMKTVLKIRLLPQLICNQIVVTTTRSTVLNFTRFTIWKRIPETCQKLPNRTHQELKWKNFPFLSRRWWHRLIPAISALLLCQLIMTSLSSFLRDETLSPAAQRHFISHCADDKLLLICIVHEDDDNWTCWSEGGKRFWEKKTF